jgi:cysteine synthase/rhodanese-related sulfurtransferase
MIVRDVAELIGNTPLFCVPPSVHGLTNVELYIKLESHNPFGSVKDRVAQRLLEGHLDGLAAVGGSVIEASSGNTAKALQLLASRVGVGVEVVSNRTRVPEMRQLLQLAGASLVQLPGLSECPDPTVPNDALSYIQDRCDRESGRLYSPSQYTNVDNIAVHRETTGEEIAADLDRVDVVIGGLGTSGSTQGIAQRLRLDNPDLKVIGVVADPSDFIPGIRSADEMWEVGLFDRSAYDEIVTVTSSEAVDATLTLLRRCGLMLGPTSGAAYSAALTVLQKRVDARRDEPVRAVFIGCDRLEPYLSYMAKRLPDVLYGHGRDADEDVIDLRQDWVSMDVEVASDRVVERSLLVVDIRSEYAYGIEHIPGSINLREDILVEMLGAGTPFSTLHELLLVCPAGEISVPLAQELSGRGVHAWSLKGGLNAWRDAGFALEVPAVVNVNQSI